MKIGIVILAITFSLLMIACEFKDDEEQEKNCDAKCNIILMRYFDRCDAHPEEPMCADTITGMTFILNSCRQSCGSDTAM